MFSLEWFIAWRYLFSRARGKLISLFAVISVVGVALGVAALIVVVGVMDGADDSLFGRMAELYPHVRIVDTRGKNSRVDEALLAQLRADPRVARVDPVDARKTLVENDARKGDPRLLQVYGVDFLGAGSVFPMRDTLGAQRYTIPDNQIVFGKVLAIGMRAEPGAQFHATATDPHRTATGFVMKTLPLVAGPYVKTGIWEFDSNTAFVNRKTFSELYLTGEGTADYLHVQLRSPFTAQGFKSSLHLAPHYRVTTWSEENSDFFRALLTEKLGMGLTLLLTVLVAAFNIVGTMILIAMEKTRAIGVLRAIGASERMITRVFLLDGVLIGIVGTTVGAVLGVGLCLSVRALDFHLPPAVYTFDTLPIAVKPLTIAVIVVSALAICGLGAIFPARQAAKMDPVAALRMD